MKNILFIFVLSPFFVKAQRYETYKKYVNKEVESIYSIKNEVKKDSSSIKDGDRIKVLSDDNSSKIYFRRIKIDQERKAINFTLTVQRIKFSTLESNGENSFNIDTDEQYSTNIHEKMKLDFYNMMLTKRLEITLDEKNQVAKDGDGSVFQSELKLNDLIELSGVFVDLSKIDSSKLWQETIHTDKGLFLVNYKLNKRDGNNNYIDFTSELGKAIVKPNASPAPQSDVLVTTILNHELNGQIVCNDDGFIKKVIFNVKKTDRKNILGQTITSSKLMSGEMVNTLK